VDKYIGIPYKLGGRDYAGADCYGLVYLILMEYGYTLPRYQMSYTIQERTTLISENSPVVLGKQVSVPEDFCVVLFYKGEYPTHMGVYLSGGVFHTVEATNSVYEKLGTGSLKRYTKMEFWRVADNYTT
jgi:cell wall-associated NlpC family hydrolase